MKKLAIALLFASLLVFGCIGGDEAAPESGVPAQIAASESAQAGASEPTQAAASEPASAEGNIFEGLDYAAIMALGQSGECTVTIQDEGVTGTMHVWFADGKSRLEMTSMQGGESFAITAISKDGKTYSDFPQAMGGIYGDCDWIEMSEEEAAGGSAESTEDYSTPDMSEMPEASFECNAAIVSASKFETLGTICTMEELTEAMTGGMGVPDTGACSGLEGQAYEDCILAQMG